MKNKHKKQIFFAVLLFVIIVWAVFLAYERASRLSSIKNEITRIQRKLSMRDDVWRLKNASFYVPNYPYDLIQSHIVDTCTFYDQSNLEKLETYLSDGAVILDLGANIGNHTVYFAKLPKTRKVYAFEPVKETFFILSKNIDINGLNSKVELFNVGLSDRKTKAKIENFPDNNIGGITIIDCEDGTLDVCRLDDIIINENRIDLIKIDVEGHEVLLLKGAEDTIRKYKPVIFIEVTRYNSREVKRILEESHGYILAASSGYAHIYPCLRNCLYIHKDSKFLQKKTDKLS
jgi:FkbM family methyltransferase